MSVDGVKVPSLVVVEDNETLRGELVLYLSEEGFSVQGVGSGEELNQALEVWPTDILILDLNLPDEDGISITQRIRRALPAVGIILLTARMRSTDRMEGYASGADVYLTKPTRPEELVAVVRNLFARLGGGPSPAQWQLDMAGLSLRTPTGSAIELTGSEARLLKELAVNGQFLEHAALLSRFGDAVQSEKTNKARLEVLISRLRTKLGPHLTHGFDIRVVRGQALSARLCTGGQKLDGKALWSRGEISYCIKIGKAQRKAGDLNCNTVNTPATTTPNLAFSAELQQRAQHFSALDLISHPVWIFDIDRRYVYWANNSAIGIWNASSLPELCTRDMGRDMSEAVAQRLAQYQSDFTASGAVFNEQWTLYPGDVPTSLHVRFNGYVLPDGRMAMLCHARPTVQETPESLRSVEALLHTPVMITLYDGRGTALYRNPAARASAHILRQTLKDRIVDAAAYAALMQAHQAEELSTFTLTVSTASGEQWHELSARRCRDAVTGNAAMLVSEVDVSALKRTEAKANFQARHDDLTGLPNRAHVIECFAAAVDDVRRRGCETALIFIDLDHFKDINDTLGHAAGDELLILVAERLRKATRSTDLVARLGGDEFLILVSSHDILAEVDQVRSRVLHSIAQPAILRGTEVRVTPTMGVSLFPRDGSDLETLLRKADLAMYSGKERGRNELAFYNDSMGTAVSARMALEIDLRHALERNEFEVHYQPLVCTRTRRIVGAEALVRWRHPTRGLMAPDSFIPLCESTGMILPLGQQVFERAAQQQSAWARLGHPMKVHVNLSPRQFGDPELIQHMQAALSGAGCTVGSMGVEITESMLLGGNDHAKAVLWAISALGLSIALDDFGTGYSNLAYLQRYPINSLKIDKTFIQSNDHERPLADLIVSLCRTLGMEVVAEGVESQEQMDWVVGRNIEQAQGYLFSKPLLPDKFLALLVQQ